MAHIARLVTPYLGVIVGEDIRPCSPMPEKAARAGKVTLHSRIQGLITQTADKFLELHTYLGQSGIRIPDSIVFSYTSLATSASRDCLALHISTHLHLRGITILVAVS
ncbi:hypothetical protein C1G87_1534 [Dehalococcoides mccartyi]|uniref:Uncharacterized protein n=1 Tax=Dehalococcoides mccartyi TaxID=61435 RepID=A0A328EK20_9CHLR|nr:hypothetical protein C1G87_1534 [Dehalococcoides mccartyi]